MLFWLAAGSLLFSLSLYFAIGLVFALIMWTATPELTRREAYRIAFLWPDALECPRPLQIGLGVLLLLMVALVACSAQVSIRTNNPGAMWPGPIAAKYGSKSSLDLGANKIAVFSDPIQGAAAQFALLDASYTGLTIRAAIARWSGSSLSGDYAQQVAESAGLETDTVLTTAILASEAGRKLAKAMARWEAGREFPLSDGAWQQAQGIALQGIVEVSALDPEGERAPDTWADRQCRPLYALSPLRR